MYFFLRLHAAAEKSDPFSLDIRGLLGLLVDFRDLSRLFTTLP